MLKGYRDGAMIVSDAALDLEFSGGAAAKAAEASVKVAAKAGEVGAKAKVQAKKGAAIIDDAGSRPSTRVRRPWANSSARPRACSARL